MSAMRKLLGGRRCSIIRRGWRRNEEGRGVWKRRMEYRKEEWVKLKVRSWER
jgi:hypothetical protein